MKQEGVHLVEIGRVPWCDVVKRDQHNNPVDYDLVPNGFLKPTLPRV